LTLAGVVATGLLVAACADNRSATIEGPMRSITAQSNMGARNDADAADPTATVVVGTGDPSVDVPAVQSAVDHGGAVLLEGHFSFDEAPTKTLASALSAAPPGLAYAPAAEVLVSKAVTISGIGEGAAGMTTIDAGTIPFYVDAPGQAVTIRRLRFVQPTSSAVIVYAVRDLEISWTTIAGVVPFKNLYDAIGINTSGPPPSLSSPPHPENISGTLTVMHNDVDVIGGTTSDNTLGIVVFGAGTAAAPVDAHVSGNRIANTTEPAINFRQIEGREMVRQNVITTCSVVAKPSRNQVIRIAGSGLYRIANNVIRCDWANPDAEGIGMFSNVAASPIEHAVVEHNEITMATPPTTVFTAFSAGIGVFGYANDNVVRRNTIRGSARAAFSIPVFPLAPQLPASPQNNAFLDNRIVDFTPAVADFFVGAHAVGTRIVGAGTVQDEGDGTVIVRRGR
jgi:hypothetical protein